MCRITCYTTSPDLAQTLAMHALRTAPYVDEGHCGCQCAHLHCRPSPYGNARQHAMLRPSPCSDAVSVNAAVEMNVLDYNAFLRFCLESTIATLCCNALRPLDLQAAASAEQRLSYRSSSLSMLEWRSEMLVHG